MGFWRKVRPWRRRWVLSVLAGALAVSSGSVLATSGGLAMAHTGGGRAARTVSIRDTANLRVVRSNGATRLDKGAVSGTLPGTLELDADIPGTSTSFTFSFTLHVAGGTITGRGKGTLHEGKPPYETFAGAGVVSGGSGRYVHVSGTGHFYGSENRRTHSGTVQVLATLRY
jgi:hypothetical protein